MQLERGPLLADDTLTGSRWCARHSALIDQWLTSLFERAVAETGVGDGCALVAIGGYGRSELCPQSDLDVMLVHAGRRDIAAIAERVWYPIWDTGLKLGHSVSTVREALTLAESDMDSATALLSTRHLAGDSTLTDDLASKAKRQWEQKSRKWLTELADRVDSRHAQAGEVAFMLEPDLKEGRGGLRDVHALQWAEMAREVLFEHDAVAMHAAYEVLLDARVELHRRTGRPSNVLALQEQDAVAAALGFDDADVFMAHIASAARSIAWTSDDAWRRVRSWLRTPRGPLGRVGRRNRPLSDGLVMRDGDVHLDPSARPAEDPVLLVRAAATAARSGAVIDRMSLDRFVAEAHTLPDPWPRSARDQFVGLLLAGASAIPVIEAFDHRDLWVRILPEWAPVRSRPQRNAYHRYTVDRHLLETVARAASFAGRVERPDLLVVAALLHDLGKVDTRDHTEVGVELAHTVGVRLGFEPTDVDVLAELVHNHLLLSEVALRRDLDDPATSARVAEQVSSVGALQLLAALTEADSLATGPAAWGPAKAQLVALLVERVTHVLEGGEPAGIIVPVFPSELHLAQLARAGTVIEAAGDVLTVMTDDRAGVFSKVSGVLALHGLDVVSASAHSTDDGRALAEFHVNDPVRDAAPWDRVERDLLRAFDGRLALQARVADRARAYAGRQRATAWRPRTATVKFDNDASLAATVIDVHASDGIGVLYRITRALAELDVDIRSARVQTLGAQVVDAFYVVDRHGRKVTDADTSAEIERAIVHNLSV
ncbi:MAG TPA: [protein-PII] uridylyltransferase [Acidimicrobiia bacterium]|nr:[protein-PII] uridylyltransferase [Acidimicrobiia bacterium]